MMFKHDDKAHHKPKHKQVLMALLPKATSKKAVRAEAELVGDGS